MSQIKTAVQSRLFFGFSWMGYGILSFLLSNPDLAWDSGQYYGLGVNWLQTGVYGLVPGIPDLEREPGYPAFIAVLVFIAQSFGLTTTPAESYSVLKWIAGVQSLIHFVVSYLFCFRSPIRNFSFSKVYFFILIFSPTLWGATTVIYSESICISWLILACYFALVANSMASNRYLAILAGVFFGFAILTKSYLENLIYIGLFFAILLWIKRQQFLAQTLFLICVSSFLIQMPWKVYVARQFGDNSVSGREMNAIAGKVLRLHDFDLKRDLFPALASAVGDNFCKRNYGPDVCIRFDTRAADGYGWPTWKKYQEEHSTQKEAKRHLLRDMVKVYFERPGVQLLGSLLEGIRISFYEAAQRPSLAVPGIHWAPALWHFLGSLVGWVLIGVGFRGLVSRRKTLDTSVQLIGSISLLFIIYHYLVMSQVTNLVRYVFPIIPFLYLFLSFGIESLRVKRHPVK